MKKNAGLLPLKMRKRLSLILDGGAFLRWRKPVTDGLRVGSGGGGGYGLETPGFATKPYANPSPHPILYSLNPVARLARITAPRIIDQLIHLLMQITSQYYGIIYY